MHNKKQIIIVLIAGFMLIGIFLTTLFFLNAKNNPADLSSQARPMNTVTQFLQPKSPNESAVSSYPAQVLDLVNWKLTAPAATVVSDQPLPQDIKQPELATYKISPWFMATQDSTGVIFRAPVNAPTTANSKYPRSELREMTDQGKEEAVWSTKVGTHTLFLEQAITAVPKTKPIVVAGQIHGDDDDLLVIRLEYPKLYVTRSKSDVVTLDANYTLGKRFVVKFVASEGTIAVYYNNNPTPVYVLKKKVDEAYFKVGVYTQSNCETEDSPALCTADNYGEVVVYRAEVTHT